MADPVKSDSIAGKLGAWIAVYGFYLFLAGWTYLDFYFAVFGINAKTLEFGLNDVIARGFTVLFDAGAWLSIVYLIVLGISVLVEALKKDSGVIYAFTAIILAVGFIPTYLIAKSAGVSRANQDRSEQTTLAHISFIEKSCSYQGKLVFIKSETLFINNLRPFPDGNATGPSCPIALKSKTELEKDQIDKNHQQIPQLWMLRTGDLQDIRIEHYQQKVEP